MRKHLDNDHDLLIRNSLSSSGTTPVLKEPNIHLKNESFIEKYKREVNKRLEKMNDSDSETVKGKRIKIDLGLNNKHNNKLIEFMKPFNFSLGLRNKQE